MNRRDANQNAGFREGWNEVEGKDKDNVAKNQNGALEVIRFPFLISVG